MTQAVAVAMRSVRSLSQREGSSILYMCMGGISGYGMGRVGLKFGRHPIGATVSRPLSSHPRTHHWQIVSPADTASVLNTTPRNSALDPEDLAAPAPAAAAI